MQPHWSDLARNLATVASVFVGMFAFYFVIRQIRQNQRAYREKSYGDLYSQQQVITKQFLDRPHLRIYFYSNQPPEAIHQIECEILAEQFSDFFEFIWLILPTLPEDIQDGWLHFMEFIYLNSTPLRDYINSHTNWYDPDLLKRIGYVPPTTTNAKQES